MTKRKTFSVVELKTMVNKMLVMSKPEAVDCRLTVASMLEKVLMDTGNYQGFKYQREQLNATGTQLRTGADESRREYF